MRESRSIRYAYFGLFQRREVWTLTWRARLLLLTIVVLAATLLIRGSHHFLAVDAPVNTGILVVEGWVPEYALTSYVARASYDLIYTIGGVTVQDRYSRDPSDTQASVAYNRLRKAGVPADKLRMVPSWVSRRDRTYGAAVALRDWCRTNNVELTAFDVVTLGPHARRSRLLQQKAFGRDAKIGVISLVNEDYDPDHWWRYSEGVKEVLSEGAAYLYVRFLFSPD